MRTLVEFTDGRTETFEDAGPSVYEDALSLIGPECETVMDDVPLSEIKRVVYVNAGEFYD
jgi:hypothetical protein